VNRQKYVGRKRHGIAHKLGGWPPMISARILDTIGRQLL
jgi:hypothetical protein